MIVFDLKCKNDHVFETWFKDSKTYERQAKSGKVSCPICGDTKIEKAPMAPAISKSKGKSTTSQTPQSDEHKQAAMVMGALRKLRAEVEKNSDYVGPKFAEEARKIHHGEVDRRNIHGEATRDEAKSLKEEGVEVVAIPWVERTDS